MPHSPTSQKNLFGSNTNPSNIVPKKMGPDSKITFRCHPSVSCFTACCGNVNIILTPFDILRMRRATGLSADEFLLRFTTPTYLEKTDLPGVKIHLDEDGRCPFVTPEGCTIYDSRPTTCRYYPVGMSFFHERSDEGSNSEEFYFLIKEDHCKGHEEDKKWTIREWRKDQGIDVSDEMNKEWMELVMRRKSFGLQATLSEPAKKMFFMASTDLDKFREFVFSPSFQSTYEIEPEILEAIREDDVELMKFSFLYLASTLYGVQGLKIRPEKIKAKAEQIKQRQAEAEQRGEAIYEELRKERENLEKMRAEKEASTRK